MSSELQFEEMWIGLEELENSNKLMKISKNIFFKVERKYRILIIVQTSRIK